MGIDDECGNFANILRAETVLRIFGAVRVYCPGVDGRESDAMFLQFLLQNISHR